MIPKVIHYCWFGRGEKPDLAFKCIASWKKAMPDYEIKEWNEENFDVNINSYVRQAYDSGKYAFVSDYARFWILYNFGGVYFDTDVEVLKSIDEIVRKGSFIGCQEDGGDPDTEGILCAPGLGLACPPFLKVYKDFLNYYEDKHFIQSDGSLDLKTVVQIVTEILIRHGLKNIMGMQFVAGINIYPKEYFCPTSWNSEKETFTPNTYTIHHFAGSWLPSPSFKQRFMRFLGSKNVSRLRLIKKIWLNFWDRIFFPNKVS